MPATIYPSARAAESWRSHSDAKSLDELLTHKYDPICRKVGSNCFRMQDDSNKLTEEHYTIVRTSFSNDTVLPSTRGLVGSSNGFVLGMMEAYNKHRHLTIRPDDVWITLLTQFNLYLNAHAKELRHLFVWHEGKKEIVVFYEHDIPLMDFVNWTEFASTITKSMEEYLVDPDLREWIQQSFSTTTDTDRAVTAIIMMGTLQTYFDYSCISSCGFPSVTLLGDRADWEKLLHAVDRFAEFGEEPRRWVELLRPILRRFLVSFDEPQSEDVTEFWRRFGRHYVQSGSDTWTGWITAFCFWDKDGRCLHRRDSTILWRYPQDFRLDGNGKWSADPTTQPRRQQSSSNDSEGSNAIPAPQWPRFLLLDGVEYHRVNSSDIPRAYASTPVTITDLRNRREDRGLLMAGAMAIAHTSKDSWWDSVRPEMGWWMMKREAVVTVNSKRRVSPSLQFWRDR